jgi:hypothetical protein
MHTPKLLLLNLGQVLGCITYTENSYKSVKVLMYRLHPNPQVGSCSVVFLEFQVDSSSRLYIDF